LSFGTFRWQVVQDEVQVRATGRSHSEGIDEPMIFTADQIHAIRDQFTAHGNMEPPQEVLLGVAALMRDDGAAALISESRLEQNITTWHVVGLLDSGCLFTADWNSTAAVGREHLQLTAQIRSVSDVSSLMLTRATAEGLHGADTVWDVALAWEIGWLDGSPAVALPTRSDPTPGLEAAVDVIVARVRQVLAAR
jgi:hypothetical protein